LALPGSAGPRRSWTTARPKTNPTEKDKIWGYFPKDCEISRIPSILTLYMLTKLFLWLGSSKRA
jgi:hypothetical protein